VSQQSFAELGVSKDIVVALRAAGVTKPFPVQEQVVPDVLAGRDVLVQSPTGSGKTLAFAVPVLERLSPKDARPAALVLAPTRELASQIVAETAPLARARGLHVAAVYGGAGIARQIAAVRKAHLVVATPGRLEDLIERGAIRLDRVRIAVLDEADRMLDMGFRPAVDRILRQTPRTRQTLFFSATLEGDVGRLADEYTRDPKRHDHRGSRREAARVDHRFVAVRHERKLDTLITHLAEEDRGRTLVFVRTKRGADRLVKRLRSRGVTAVAMHGDKTQGQRERALRGFHAGAPDTLVATDVAARGIDVEDITHVINFDVPADRDAYVHRVGRTGRAGRSGTGITYVLDDQVGDLRGIARDLRLQREFDRRKAA
jgi:superfamily II DNA/RNA helicase